MAVRQRTREIEMDVDIIERRGEVAPARAHGRDPERGADREAEEAGGHERPKVWGRERPHLVKAAAHATALSMDRDAAHWEAVEEAVELLHEERYREAME